MKYSVGLTAEAVEVPLLGEIAAWHVKEADELVQGMAASAVLRPSASEHDGGTTCRGGCGHGRRAVKLQSGCRGEERDRGGVEGSRQRGRGRRCPYLSFTGVGARVDTMRAVGCELEA